ncbi:MAG: 30S ribosomal protein S4, partial [Brachybacterium sp.]|nr:30S ribosomal protein S4 [Brachybacterium sp.]
MTNVNRARRQARLSRALGLPLTPKSVKYFEKRPYPPGGGGRGGRRAAGGAAGRREGT